MQIIITADIHNGAQDRLKDTIWSMDIISNYATDHKINTILVLGDLFHDRYTINTDTYNQAYTSLKKYKQKGQRWISFPGNHDMFLKDSWKITSIKPLEQVMEIIDEIKPIELDNQKFWILPFIYYEDKYMQQLSKIEEEYQPGDILLTHIGVKNATLNECFLLKNWSTVDFKDSKFKTVFAGHFHCQQEVGPVHYPGSPIPFRFDEGLVDHGFLIYDTKDKTKNFIKTYDICKKYSDYKAPDYLTVTDKNLLSINLTGNNIKVILTKDYTANELIKIKEILTEKKGAIKISWTKPEKEIKQLDSNTTTSQDDLFNKWIEHDNPTDYNKELLLEIYSDVKNVAEERAVNVEDDDG
jgi:DNA repair exonuclease SbcCD nuclease subunit